MLLADCRASDTAELVHLDTKSARLPLPKRACRHPRFIAGCGACQAYDRNRQRRRTRLKAYGQWEGSTVVPTTGTVRRLQALAVAGFGLEAVAAGMGLTRNQVWRWRYSYYGAIHTHSRDRVAAYYEQHWGEEGPDRHAASIARGRGWHPFEAWTDATIDNPDAEPYSDPEAAAYVDWLKVKYAQLPVGHPQRVRYVDLAPAEQRALFETHATGGGSARGFLARYRPVPIKDLRRLSLEVLGEPYGR